MRWQQGMECPGSDYEHASLSLVDFAKEVDACREFHIFWVRCFSRKLQGSYEASKCYRSPQWNAPCESGGQAGTPGYNFHFWSSTQYFMPKPSDVGGVYTVAMARLVPANASLPTNYTNVRYLMSIGPDFRKTKTQQPPDNTGMGRFKWVTPYWRTYNSINWTPAQIVANPPPL
jgi:hypothetical protein